MEEGQDAFAVLLSSQLPPSKRRRSDQDKYAPCPICGTSIPQAFLTSHTEDCLAKNAKPSPDPAAAAAGSSARSSPVKSQTLQPQLFGSTSASPGPADAPVLSPRRQRLPPDEFKAMVSAGWDKALKHIPVDEAPAQQQPQPKAAPQHQAPIKTPSTAQRAAARVPAAAGKAVNAFAVLQAAQAAQVPMDAEMFLEGRADGSWLWHWRLAGAHWSSSHTVPEPCWSATINANLPRQQQAAHAGAGSSSSSSNTSSSKAMPTGSVKLRLQVSTNIPPSFGGAVDWENPLLPSNGLHAAAGQQGDVRQPVAGLAQGPNLQQQQQQDMGDGKGSAGGSSSTRWRGGGPGVLISALQKSVRRGCAASATKIALELLKEPKTAEALARRLSIICLEDGLLHPQLPLVVWTMLALGKGYGVGGHLANALLSITHQMASISYRDFMPWDLPTAPAAGVHNAPATWHAVDAALGLSTPESIMVKSILLRAAYGGMAGDKAMLLSYAGLWTARFSGCTLPPPPPPPLFPAAAGAQQQPAQLPVAQPGSAQGKPSSEQVHQQAACMQSQQQEQGHEQGPGLQQQRGEGQHQQQSSGGATPPPTAQSPSQFFTQQGTPLTASASQGEVLRPQWVQQVQQGPEQQRDGSQVQQSQQQDVPQPTQSEAAQELQWGQVRQQQLQQGVEQQQHGQSQQHTGQASSEGALPLCCGPSSSSSQQQQGQHSNLVRATEHASPHSQQPPPADNLGHDSAQRSSLRSQGTTDSDGAQLHSSQPSNPVQLESHPRPSTEHAAPLRNIDGGRPVGAYSSWLQYLQQQYSRLSMLEPQRVTVVGAVTREDIPLAAVDFHVAPALTQHLKEQPQLKAAVRGMISTSPAVAARLSGPDGFEGLINSTIWQLRSSINRKAWIQYQYIQHLPSTTAGAGDQVLNRQLLEAAAVAAVSAWSCAGHAVSPGNISTDVPSAGTHPAGASSSAAATSSRQLLKVASEGQAGQLPPGTGFSEGALRVLEMEVSGVVAFEAEQRRLRQELLPLWKAGLASLADAWCREFLSRRVY